jgi:hypothetical protein
MIRQFPAVPHDAVNEFYDLKGNVNLDYLRSAKTADIATEVDNEDDSVDSGIPGLQTRHSNDASSDDDSDYDKEPNKTPTTMKWKIPIDDSDGGSLLADAYQHNAQNEMQNVCIIVENRLQFGKN